MKLKILSVVGARPNFMKIAPFIRAINEHNKKTAALTSKQNHILIEHTLVHTGQHYDPGMSKNFIQDLNISEPDINLGIGSGTHAEQVGQTMIAFEKVAKKHKPDWIVVVGDVNATLACSVTAKKEHMKCCHIEAGLRSGDITMPEEINRLVTDRLCDLLLTPDRISTENLRQEGVSEDKIKFVGNIMIDTLEANRTKAEKLNIEKIISKTQINNDLRTPYSILHTKGYALMTLHRPSNVDEIDTLEPLVDFITREVTREIPLIWPVHPRTKKQLELFRLWDKVLQTKNLFLLQPVGYQEMLRLNMDARVMLTDSGGLQEECTILGTPCLTLRPVTERPVTLREYGGASVLVGNDINQIRKEFLAALKHEHKPHRPELWDGKTAERCVQAIINASK